jgi:hypothetical protein
LNQHIIFKYISPDGYFLRENNESVRIIHDTPETTRWNTPDFNTAFGTMATMATPPNPSVLEDAVFIPKAKGRFSPGTFVELATGTVAMILQTSGQEHSESAPLPPNDLPDSLRPRRVRVALLHPFADRRDGFTISRWPCLARDSRHVPELVTTALESVVSTQDIIRICFVFHPSMPGLKLVCIQGMSAVYVCRYDNTGAEIDLQSWRPFPSAYEDYNVYFSTCVPSTVWRSLSATQQAFRKLLGRVSENQGLYPKGRSSVRLSAEAWCYLQSKIGDSIPIRERCRNTVKRAVGSGLVLSTQRDSRPSQLYRFETMNDMQVLVQILGETAIADVRKRKPRLGKELVLRSLDTINVVPCSFEEHEREAPFSRYSEEDGVDLEYDGDELHITIRYRQYILNRNTAGLLVGCPSVLLERLINRQALLVDDADDDDADDDDDNGGGVDNDDENDNDIEEDSEFMMGNLLYRVHEYMPGVHVRAKCIYPRGPAWNTIMTFIETHFHLCFHPMYHSSLGSIFLL